MRLALVIIVYTFAALARASGEIDPTPDLLKKLQDTGVLDNVKEELEKMLHEKKLDLNGLKEDLKNANIKPQTDEAKGEVEDARAAFMKNYGNEMGFIMKAEVIKSLAKVPGDGDKIKHMRQLVNIVDLVGPNKDLQDRLVDQTFKSIAELVEFVNVENNKIKAERKAAKQKKEDENSGGTMPAHNVAQTIRMFTGMAKSNPAMLVTTLFATLANYDIVSKEVMKEMMQHSEGFIKSELFVDGVTYVGESLAVMAESDVGSMMFQLVPLLMNEEGREEAFEKFKTETKDKWFIFIESIRNSDTKMDFLMQCARKANNFYQYIFKDEMKMMMANAFLISQQLPPLLSHNLFESLLDISIRSFELFTTNDIDLKPFKAPIRKFVKDMEQEYLSAEEFDKLNEDEQARLIARFLDDNIVQLLFDLYQINDFIWFRGHAKCAKHLLCEFNEKISKEGNEIKKSVTHGLSLVLAWVWGSSPEDFGNEFELYSAANFGAGENEGLLCKQKYIHEGDECKYFKWQKYHVMNLSFDHNEL